MVIIAPQPWASVTPTKSVVGAKDDLSRRLTGDGTRRRPKMRSANATPAKTEQPLPTALGTFLRFVPQIIEAAIVLQLALADSAEASIGERVEMITD